MTNTPARERPDAELVRALRDFAEHLEPVSGDYAEEIGALSEAADRLDALIAALATIEIIASGSTTANSLPHIARLARSATTPKPGPSP